MIGTRSSWHRVRQLCRASLGTVLFSSERFMCCQFFQLELTTLFSTMTYLPFRQSQHTGCLTRFFAGAHFLSSYSVATDLLLPLKIEEEDHAFWLLWLACKKSFSQLRCEIFDDFACVPNTSSRRNAPRWRAVKLFSIQPIFGRSWVQTLMRAALR